MNPVAVPPQRKVETVKSKSRGVFSFTAAELKRMGVGFVSVSKAAQLLGTSRRRVQRAIQADLEAWEIRGRLFVHRSDLAAYRVQR